jgi:Fe-S-cluster-containing dehydrogenase component
MDLAAGVMKKCTLCIDRIYNETFEEVDRVPACVRTCPANARHFGDFADPNSAVSVMVAERGGMDLMPEQGTRPVNKYLPPRPRKPLSESAAMFSVAEDTDGAKGFFAWLDGMLDRI